VAARLDEQKGHEVLLEAAASLPEVIFVLASEGPKRARLEARSAALGLGGRVRFLGQRDDVGELIELCDVFALPSLYEGSSLSLLEAMSAERPAVTSDIPGTDKLVTDGVTGLLTPPGDPVALAATLRRVLGDPELRRRLGRRARRRVLSKFTIDVMARTVTSVYRELLEDVERGPSKRSTRDNALLRTADWRFLLRQGVRPTALNLASGRLAKSVDLVADPQRETGEPVDLVVLSNPGSKRLNQARVLLRPGGELVSCWSRPRPRRTEAILQALSLAGFEDISLYWPGPAPSAPQFWMRLNSPRAQAHILDARPISHLRDRLLHLGWHAVARSGMLAPIYAVARVGGEAHAAGDLAPESAPPELLLTGGSRAINKAVALEFSTGSQQLSRVIKFARIPEAEPRLANEAAVLEYLARTRADLDGVPTVLGRESRAGESGVAESALFGTRMLDALTPASYPGLAERVTDWLIALAGHSEPAPPAQWWERLVETPLATFASQFGMVLSPGLLDGVVGRLRLLGDLPIVFEHRDCSPWNIVLGKTRRPALLDWESAEPKGLPCLDLVYFLANTAFVLDGALETGTTRSTYRRSLDARTVHGRVAADCLDRYCTALGLDRQVLPALRLLTWIVHAPSDFQHMELDGRAHSAALRNAPFLGLVEEELLWSDG
jgi:hypothetical protein